MRQFVPKPICPQTSLSPRQFVPKTVCPRDSLSPMTVCPQNSLSPGINFWGQTVLGTNCLGDKLVWGQTVLGTNCRWGQTAWGQTVSGQTVWGQIFWGQTVLIPNFDVVIFNKFSKSENTQILIFFWQFCVFSTIFS